MATSAEYVDTVWYRLTKGKPQPLAELWRAAVQSTLGAALQRLGDRVAADEGLYPLLVNEYALTLVTGQVDISGQDPVLLLSEHARAHWRVTMTDIRFPLKYLPNRFDLDNPPPTSDYVFYTVFNKNLVVRDYLGAVPTETAVQLFGNYTPEIDDSSLEVDGQLFDNLADIGAALVLESGTLEEVIRQAETAVGTAPALQ